MSNSVSEATDAHDGFKDLWKKCRDAIRGHDKIQQEGKTYLPKLSGQEKDDYKKYKEQALFYPATGRTYKAFKGLIFRKESTVNLPDSMDDFQADVTLSGMSLKKFAELAVEEELKVSRFGILVDYPTLPEDSNLSQREAEQRGIRPFLVSYTAEDIIGDPQTRKVGTRTILSKIRLKEHYVDTDPEDEFKHVAKERVRVLDLAPPPEVPDEQFDEYEGPLYYRQRVFFPSEKDDTIWEEHTDQRRYPKMQGELIEKIPFYIVGGHEYREPTLLDLVNVNLSHYVAYADHRRGVSFTTRPQPYGTGVKEEEMPDSMVMGGGSFWNFPSSEAEIGMLEYSGEGLTASENMLKDLVEMMASVGARLLMPESNVEETATEFVIKKQGENSALGTVAKNVSDALTEALKFAARWASAPDDEVGIKLNTDFIPFQATPEDVVKMIGAVQTGLYSIDDYLWWLKQSEMVDPTKDEDEREAELQTTPPPGMGGP